MFETSLAGQITISLTGHWRTSACSWRASIKYHLNISQRLQKDIGKRLPRILLFLFSQSCRSGNPPDGSQRITFVEPVGLEPEDVPPVHLLINPDPSFTPGSTPDFTPGPGSASVAVSSINKAESIGFTLLAS